MSDRDGKGEVEEVEQTDRRAAAAELEAHGVNATEAKRRPRSNQVYFIKKEALIYLYQEPKNASSQHS